MARPQLSIGIIFKNEIRCLERCLKSFQALREAVPCEIVMADTGSTDGSHEIAAKYADILFDFPWVNDFAAARNAVMDRCSGKWFFSVDADEWLDEDFSQLLELLTSPRRILDKIGSVVVRNYQTEALDPRYSTDLHVVRLVRMSSHIRYVGKIHEYIPLIGENKLLRHIVLHHDGYVGQGTARGKAKLERNRELLCLEVSEHPDDVRLQCLYVESAFDQPDYYEQIELLVEKVQAKKREWKAYGPSAMRHAVIAANQKNSPQTEEWAEYACSNFPESFFTRIDVAYIMAHRCWKNEDYAGCENWCATYLRAIDDFHNGTGDMWGLTFGILRMVAASSEQTMRTLQIKALYRCGKTVEAEEILNATDSSVMDNNQFASHVRTLIGLYAEEPIQRLYDRLTAPEYPEAHAEAHRNVFMQEAASTFAPKYREKEESADGFAKNAYTLFAPLNGKCEIGTAAAIMQTGNIAELEQLLREVEDWDYLPVAALEHALEKGVQFPPSGKLLSLEAMDKLAGRLGKNAALAAELTLQAADVVSDMDLPDLLWARGVAIVAVQACDWKDAEHGMRLCRAFARIVGAFVTRYYTEEALCGDNFRMLPGMYRSAWYCQEAFKALDGGDCGMYIKLLREGLLAYPGTKKMASFLLDNTPEVQELLAPPPEVQALVDQVRTVLARYAPDDPAVVALKQSEAYQKVAHLLK